MTLKNLFSWHKMLIYPNQIVFMDCILNQDVGVWKKDFEFHKIVIHLKRERIRFYSAKGSTPTTHKITFNVELLDGDE